MGALFFLRLKLDVDGFSAVAFDIDKDPVGMLLAIVENTVEKVQDCGAGNGQPFFFCGFCGNRGCDAVEQQPCRQKQAKSPPILGYNVHAHGLFHKHAHGVAVGGFHFHKVSDGAMADKFYNLCKVYAFECFIARKLRHLHAHIERNLYKCHR